MSGQHKDRETFQVNDVEEPREELLQEHKLETIFMAFPPIVSIHFV